MEEFYCNDGTIAFVIPFLFTREELGSKNSCTKRFGKIKPNDSENDYEKNKKKILDSLKYAFPDAQKCYPGIAEIDDKGVSCRKCNYCNHNNCNEHYQGRNLCHCFSVSRKFHDDRSRNIPRIEIFLGTYKVHYELTGSNNTFDFPIDLLLLLSNEDGVECGYLVFNIPLQSIREKGILPNGWNSLDKIIFLKHLFYKNSLKCSFNGSKSIISIQEWAEDKLCCLLEALGISKFNKSVGNYVFSDKQKNVAGAAFRYSIIDLNNILDSSNNLIPVSEIDEILRKYRNQLYGLLVSDEGWRYISEKGVQHKFVDNCWASRSFMTTFFLGHNALFINQYSIAEKMGYYGNIENWYDNYKQRNDTDYYSKYVSLRPCVPGIASLTFFSFLNAIAKELKIEKVKTASMSKTLSDEEKYKKMESALQRHSMFLDEIKNIDDCIYSQFGIPTELKDLHESYLREANNVQNAKVMNLTHVSACISIAACFIAMLAISRSGSLYAGHLTGTKWLLIAALFLPLIIYILSCRPDRPIAKWIKMIFKWFNSIFKWVASKFKRNK